MFIQDIINLNKISSFFGKLALLVFLIFSSKICNSQFHPSITPVLRSTTLSSGDYLINDDGNAVIPSYDMFVGIVDTVTKEILYDTSYFRPTCPFGSNGFARVIEHHKGGYIGAGILNECDRDQAILLWMNDTLAEISSFLTPSGFQGTQPIFGDIAADPDRERVYALKRFQKPLWTTEKQPIILYTFTDSLSLIQTDTIAQDFTGVPQVDFNVHIGLMAISYRTADGTQAILNTYDVENGTMLSADSFQLPTAIGDIHFFKNIIVTLQSEAISQTGNFLKVNNYIRSYDYLGEQIKEVKLSGEESYMSSGGNNFISKDDVLGLFYRKNTPIFNGLDSVLQIEAKAMFLTEDFDIIHEIDIAKGPSYAPSQDPNQYSFDGVLAADADESYLYYYISIRDNSATQSVYNFNRISLDQVLSSTEISSAKTDFRIYPNPASDHIQITETSIATPAFISLTDITGNLILNTNYKPTLDISFLPHGTYIITLQDAKGKPLNSNLFIH